MNVGSYKYNQLNSLTRHNGQKQIEKESFSVESRPTKHSAANKDDLVSKFWNLTDSMPRENQVSFAATVVAGRIARQGITDENKSFLQNISNRFSPEEIGAIRQQVMNHPTVKGNEGVDIDKFIREFDQFIKTQKSDELESMKKQQANPALLKPEDIFFQTTFNSKFLNRTANV